MTKVESIPFRDFLNRKFHHERVPMQRSNVILHAGFSAAILFLGLDSAFASSGIDQAATIIYNKLLNVGKWIIIIKGGIDTINSVTQGDFGGAKKNFFGYLVVYLVLNGLPWAMDEVDKVFKQM